MKTSVLAWTVAGLAACGSVPANKPDAGGSDGNGGGMVDALPDAVPKACTQTTCSNDMLEVCGDDGMVLFTEPCGLGCHTGGDRCNLIDPSNGLASHVVMAGQQADVTLPAGSTINTDTGTVMAPNGAVAVATTTVAQSGGPTLRVLMAKSWIIENVRVSGSLPLAIVSSGDITVRGVLDLSADGATAGPGAFNCGGTGTGGAPGSGFWSRVPAGNSGGYPAYLWQSNGAGGGGFGTAGGAGGERTNQFPVGAGGIINGTSNLVPLRGGCAGNALIASYAGAGGGALQLVTNKTVRLVDAGASKGIIHVGGGRGAAAPLGKAETTDPGDVTHPGSGGSGGGILIEAAALVLDANTALLAAGGGGGGYGACTPAPNGLDAPASASTPVGGGCPGGITPAAAGGDGGTTTTGGVGAGTTNGCAGSGGGGVGRIRVNTSDGQYTATGALVRGAATTGMAGKH